MFFLASPAAAQHGFDVWTADNGLPQNIIRDVCQTPDGYLWVVTLDALARFDGVRFTVFNRANSPGIESPRFTQLYEDRNGDLWLPTEASGVTRYRQGRFTTYTTQNGLPHNDVRAVTGDESGNLWVLSGNSIAQWEEGTGRFHDVTPSDSKAIWDMFRWQANGIWGQDGQRLYSFVKGNLVTYPFPDWLRGSSLSAVAADQDGALWLETKGGKRARIVNGQFQRSPPTSVIYRDRLGNSWTIGVGPYLGRYMTYPVAGHTEKISFVSLREDREGNLWLATEGQGLYRAHGKFVTVYSKEEGLADRVVYPIFQDREGAIWIGAWPAGLSRWQNGKVTNYTDKDGLVGNLLTALGEDRQGRLWAATQGGLRVFERGRFRPPDGVALPDAAVVQAIHLDRQGALWFGSSRGIVRFKDGVSRLFTTKDGLVSDDVRVIAEGSAGDLWIGGFGGVSRLRDGRFTRWTEQDGLPSNAVRAIYEDSDGVVWIGTYDGGLGRLQNGRFTRYTMREGLFNNGVFRILEDARGNFWMSSNRGIYRVGKRELNEFAAGARSAVTSVSYGRSDGMRNEECNGGSQPAGIRARDGKLWFPTQDGVAVIDPEAVPANPQPPPVEIESFLLDRALVPLDRPLRIAPDKTNFEIQYTALSFIGSGQIRFRYKLQALDSGWVDAGTRRTAYYSHVPPGRYLFTVIAGNRDGVWNERGKSLQITVLTPYYQTWWFQLLGLLSAGLLATAAWRYRVSHIEREHALHQAFSRRLLESQESERQRMAAELHDSLGQQLLIIKNRADLGLRFTDDPGRSHEQFDEIAASAASAIDEVRQIAHNLRPLYLEKLGVSAVIEEMIEKVSGASGIQFFSTISPLDGSLPPDGAINLYRVIQESINNIVKHGHATKASVEIRCEDRDIHVVVSDNGCGFHVDGPRRQGLGLTSIAERVRMLGGTLAVTSAPDRGTTLAIRFPRANGGTNAV